VHWKEDLQLPGVSTRFPSLDELVQVNVVAFLSHQHTHAADDRERDCAHRPEVARSSGLDVRPCEQEDLMTERLEVSYVLPVRWTSDHGLAELARYLAQVSTLVREVIVVDGSPTELRHAHRAAIDESVRVLPPEPWPGGNGKVAGVMTGVRVAACDRIILADDDVRYGADELRTVADRLADADLVRPQNVFTELPWHARWDTGRSLVNRSLSADYPGTFGIRRSSLLAAGGYAGDVLFENLELIRTIRAVGGRERIADDVFVARRPPSAAQFWSQRVRQAYDDFGQPLRLLLELSLLPLIVCAVRRPVAGVGLATVVLALAEHGRRRHGGRAHFARSAAVWALPWVAERAVCVWLALAARATGGVWYAGNRLVRAAHSESSIRRRLAGRAPQQSS
jgi:hypothetical protein